MTHLDRFEMVDRVHLALRQAGETYKPSPGQVPDHVHHRVAELAIAEIWLDIEMLMMKRDELINMQYELREMVRRLEVVTHADST